MPVDRTIAEGIGTNLIALYADAEARILTEMARRLAQGMDQPDWATQKLLALGDLRRWTQQLLAGLRQPGQEEAIAAILQAMSRGRTAALAELDALAADPAMSAIVTAGREAFAAKAISEGLPGAGALGRLAEALADKMASAHVPIIRWVEDAYQEVVARVANVSVLAGVETRRKASDRAWAQLIDRGITGFTDRGGRRWNLASYVEMATRTGTAQAAVQAHLDQLQQAGHNLVVVSNAPQECLRCRPWEGKVLAIYGNPGGRTLFTEHARLDEDPSSLLSNPLSRTVEGKLTRVHIAATVGQATAAGLMHPNCRHSLSLYIPGVTRIPTHTADTEGNAARQRLRELERRVRRAKMTQQAGITPQQRAQAAVRVRQLQAAIRAHVDATAHLGIFRHPERERINLGNRPGTGGALPTLPGPKPPAPTKPTLADLVASVTPDSPRTKLAGGESATVALVELPDGTRIVAKRGLDWGTPEEVEASLRRQADAEVLAALVANAIGAPVADTYRSDDDPSLVWMTYVEGQMIGELKGSETKAVMDSPAGVLVTLLDQLIANGDRNAGNLLVSDGHPVGIDHGWAWGPFAEDGIVRAVYSRLGLPDEFTNGSNGFKPNPLTRKDLEVLRSRLAAMRAQFEAAGRGDWWEHTMRVLDILEAHATGEVDLIA